MNPRHPNGRRNGNASTNPTNQPAEQHAARPRKYGPILRPLSELAGVKEPAPRTEATIIVEYTGDPDFVRAMHTKRLEEIYDKAIAGHERSCEDELIQKRTAQGDAPSSEDAETETRKKRDASKYKVETTTREKPGDIRFLAEARAALAEIRRIWGIEAAGNTRDRIAESISKIAIEAASDSDISVLNQAFETLHRLAALDVLEQPTKS